MAGNTFRASRPRRGRLRRWALAFGVAAIGAGVWLSLGDAPEPEPSTATTAPDRERREMQLTLPGQSPREQAPALTDDEGDALTPAPEAQPESAGAGSPAPGGLLTASLDAAAAPTTGTEEAATEAPEENTGAVDGGAVETAAKTFSNTLATLDAEREGPDLPGEWQSFEVRSGDNLAAVFKRAGLGAGDVHKVVNAGERADELVRLFPGDVLELRLDGEGELHGLRYELNETETLLLTRSQDEGFTPEIETRALETRVAEAQGTIDSSLYMDGLEAGLDDRLIMELAGIFGWDVDFALDLRDGDSFVVIYEELYRDGEKVRNGKILAAEFTNRGERFRAVRFTEPEGESNYYAPDGRSMRKAFLRTPVDFTRVSSDFNPSRVHPVHGTRRPHMGTDYAAPPGTPIKASGDGKIIHRGRKGGYGHTVIIQHGTRYTTLYAHMRSYRSGLSVGDRVQQGDIIGYVGSTGLSTGPHLHYEFRVDGRHRNPRTVDLPEAQPIAAEYRDEFEAHSREYIARLDTLSRTLLARIETD